MTIKTTENRQHSIQFETRAEGKTGYCSGYAIHWNSIDSYNTYFSKGSCKKTLQEKWGESIAQRKIKLLWNHDHSIPIGVPTILREDDKGLYFEAELNLDTQLGSEVYSLMKQGAINTMSFGFRKINSSYDSKGVENFKEISLLELSPVIFESNKNATINEVRGVSDTQLRKQIDDFIMTLKTKEKELEQNLDTTIKTDEVRKEVDDNTDVIETKTEIEEVAERAQDFEETKTDLELQGFNYKLQYVLEDTLDDIWWDSDFEDEDFTKKLDKVLNDFHASYLEHAQEFIKRFGKNERKEQFIDESQKRFSDYIDNSGKDFDALVRNTSLTDTDIKALRKGKSHFVAASKLDDLDEELRSIVKDSKVKNIKTLKSEIRNSDISKADKQILSALLFTKDSEVSDERSLPKIEAEPKEEIKDENVVEQRSVSDILESFLSEMKKK